VRVHGEWFTLTDAIEDAIEEGTRPDKYTWGAVRLWLKKLEEESEAIANARIRENPEFRAELERRAQHEMEVRVARARMTQLERLEADGAIYFPFRAKEPA
jgi:hypothetical protein